MTPQKRYAVCMLASEVAPLSKTGGLADVAGALSKALVAAGHDVRLFTPAYSSIDRAACAARPVPNLTKLRLVIGAQAFAFSVLRGKLPGGTPVYLIDCPALFARATPLHQRCGRAPALHRLHARRPHGLPRDALGAAHRPLQRLAHRLRPAVPAHGPQGRAAVRHHQHAADDPQHRLPGHLRRRARAGPGAAGRRRCRGCTHRTWPPARSTRCATGSSMRMRSTRSVPPTRARSAPASTAWGWRTACARAART